VSKRARHGLRQFTELLAAIRAQGATAVQPALEHLLDAVDYLTFVNSLTELENDSREEMVYELLADAQRFDATEAGGLAGYLARVSLLTSEDHGVPPANAVSLLTLHSAKGLEFDYVFMVGLEEQLFPHERSLLSGDEADIEEERRLFYVGLTRARRRCFLLHAEERTVYGEATFRRPSRFLGEIPATHLENFGNDDDDGHSFGQGVAEPLDFGFHEGDRVHHGHFGYGRLVRLYGSGQNSKATVLFPGQGEKTLLLAMAGLQKVEAEGGPGDR
jgi:DNA helicase-2/ATP-dependent DNA helicase PcrA